MRKRPVFIVFLFALLLPQAGFAQYPFGKNKVNYSSKDWKVLKTEHVDIYYYPSQTNLVTFMAPVVEETFVEYSELFNLEFRDRLPLVFYSSHYDFQQTNIIPSLISEYTGGFTDLIKGRIAIPFTGSMWELRHVIRHEMVHAFMLEKIAVVMSDHNRFTYGHPPLWFIEGLAEYVASPTADTRSHMFVRDGLINSRLPDLQNIWRINGSFLMYKMGESVVRYIAASYGDEALTKILENWWLSDDFPLVLKYTINMNLYELNDAYFKSIKRKYYPTIMYATFTPDAGKQLTRRRTFSSRPAAAVGPNGDFMLYALCAQDGVINVCRMVRNERGKLVRDRLVEGGRSSRFESIPAFRSKIEVVGDVVIFVAKRNERDAIYMLDVAKKREIRHLTFEGLSVVSSPTVSPNLDRVVFTAIDETGTMDLFLYDIGQERLSRLTNDTYNEEDPDFHPSKDLVIFSSNRCEVGNKESQGIYSIDLQTRELKPLTCGPYSDSFPEWAPDGQSFLFTSDRDGIFNAYLFEYDDNVIVQQTSVLGGITTPTFLPDQSGFVASGYYKGEFHLFEFPIKGVSSTNDVTVARVDSSTANWMKQEPKEFTYTTQDYKQKLGLDFAGAGLAIDPDFGSLGNGGSIALSDILGNHQYYFFFGNTSEGSDNFFKRLNVGVNYVNLSHRLNYSLGAFHLMSYRQQGFSIFRSERRYGGALGLSYPFSKFNRVDASAVVRYIERESEFEGLALRKSLIGTLFLQYVSDNTLWTIGGPLKGLRYYVTVGKTFDFLDRGFENTTVQFDVRKYFNLTRRIVLAERFQTRHSFGSDFQIYYLGGPWDLRGYNFREFFGRSTYLINSELRFPLIDRFALALPFGSLEFPVMRGALFLDAGQTARYFADTGWLGSVGLGTELNLGYGPVIRVNFTRATDFSTISNKTEFELFIGLNY